MPYFDADEMARQKELQEDSFATTVDIWHKKKVTNNRGNVSTEDEKLGTMMCRLADLTRSPLDKAVAEQLQGKQGFWVTFPQDKHLELGYWIIVTDSPNTSQIGAKLDISSNPVTGTYSTAQRALASQTA